MGGKRIHDARDENSKLQAMLELQEHVIAAKQERRVCAFGCYFLFI